jgi:hypothetical protein
MDALTPDSKPISEVHNLSARALSLAQVADMLASGSYVIQLEKPEIPGLPWHVEIYDKPARVMDLSKRAG